MKLNVKSFLIIANIVFSSFSCLSQVDSSLTLFLNKINKELELQVYGRVENTNRLESMIVFTDNQKPHPLTSKVRAMVAQYRKESKMIIDSISSYKRYFKKNNVVDRREVYSIAKILKDDLNKLQADMFSYYKHFSNGSSNEQEIPRIASDLINEIGINLSSDDFMNKYFPEQNSPAMCVVQLSVLESQLVRLEEDWVLQFAIIIGARGCPPQEVIEVSCDSIAIDNIVSMISEMKDSIRLNGYRIYSAKIFRKNNDLYEALDFSKGLSKAALVNNPIKIKIEADVLSSIRPGPRDFYAFATQVFLIRNNKIIKGPGFEFADEEGNLELVHEFSTAMPGDLIQIIIYQIKDVSYLDALYTQPFIINVPIK